MPKYQQHPSGCAMGSLLETLTRPWTLHILWSLRNHGEMRFGSLRRSIEGISARVLTERLRGLEAAGFVYRDDKATTPPQICYGMTEKMKQIEKILDQLHDLAVTWQNNAGQGKNTTSHQKKAA